MARAARANDQQLLFDLTLSPAKSPDEPREFEMLAYSGVAVDRPFGRAVFDVETMSVPPRVPILLDHDPSKIVGYARNSAKESGQLSLRGVLSKVTEHGRQAAGLSDEGFPWKASVGLQVGEWSDLKAGEKAVVNGREVVGPMSIGRKCSLKESSFLMAGADQNTYAVALAAATVEEEARMSPEEFLAAHKETVEGWKKEAAVQERASLAVFLGAFPKDRQLWAVERWSAGKSVTEAKAELADVLLAEAEKAVALAPAAPPVKAEAPVSAAPVGVGFNGAIREGGKAQLAAMPLEDRAKLLWEKNENDLQGEFLDSFSGFLRACRDGLVEEVTA